MKCVLVDQINNIVVENITICYDEYMKLFFNKEELSHFRTKHNNIKGTRLITLLMRDGEVNLDIYEKDKVILTLVGEDKIRTIGKVYATNK